jgi:hypothetical protein
MTRKRNQRINCEIEETRLFEALHIAGIRAARSIAGSAYTISSKELNISAHLVVYSAFLSIYCNTDEDIPYVSEIEISSSEWESIVAPIQNYYRQYGVFSVDELHEVGKELSRFAAISFRTQGGFVEEEASSDGGFDYKLYDDIHNVLKEFFELRMIPQNAPLTILDPFAGTCAGICLHLLCHYKLSANIKFTWKITAIDPDPVSLASAQCMLRLCSHIWDRDLGVVLTAQVGTFLLSEKQKMELKEELMHHHKKERYMRDVNPVHIDESEEQYREKIFDIVITAPKQRFGRSYPLEVLHYLESVYQTGNIEYMHIEAVFSLPAKMRIIVQQKSWLTEKRAEQYRAWIQRTGPTDIIIGNDETVCIWNDAGDNQQSATVYQKNIFPFQLQWSELDPTQGWKLQDPSISLLIHHLMSVGQPLSSYLLGEICDQEDDYLCAILDSYIMKEFMKVQKDRKNVPIIVPDPYNPEEQELEGSIKALYQKKRILEQKGASREEALHVHTLLEQEIWTLYRIPPTLQQVIMMYAQKQNII